jgi:CheY-like chemotaxis protein
MKALSPPRQPFSFDVSGPGPVMLIDDDDDAILLIQLLFKRAGVTSPVTIATDGEQAVGYFRSWMKERAVPLPQIVFLDLKLPRTSGFEVLKWIRSQPELAGVPVVIMSSSNRPLDMETARALGADFYCEKYPAHEELVALFEGRTDFPVVSDLYFG